MANISINPYGTGGELPSNIGVVNDLVTGGAGKALSAEMGVVIKREVNSLYTSLDRLHSKLANLAFMSSTDQNDAEPTPINWGVPQVTVSITNNIGVGANIKANGNVVSNDITLDAGSSLTLTIEPTENYLISNVAATVNGDSATITEDDGIYTLTIAEVGVNTTIAISGTVTQEWYTVPKNDLMEGASVVMYGMQQGRAIFASGGATTAGTNSTSANSTPLFILMPAGYPENLKIYTGGSLSGNATSSNSGKTEASYIPTAGKRYLHIRMSDTSAGANDIYKFCVGCYGNAVIGNSQSDVIVYGSTTTIDGWVGRWGWEEPNNGDMTWKLDLHTFATNNGKTAGDITYIKLLTAKYPNGASTATDSRSWYDNMTITYKFTDD